MPKDDWIKARNRARSSGRSYEDEREQEKMSLAAVDSWIAAKEAYLESKKNRKGNRQCCDTKKGKGPHKMDCCNYEG